MSNDPPKSPKRSRKISFTVPRNKGQGEILVEGEWMHDGAEIELARSLGSLAADLWCAGKLNYDDERGFYSAAPPQQPSAQAPCERATTTQEDRIGYSGPMRQFIDGTRHAVAAQSWYAALGLALAIPDIAGWVETPPPPGQSNSGARYTRWFDANVRPAYTASFPEPHVFLNGADCYALRCAYLHQGDFDTSAQRARDVLQRFRFVVSPGSVSFHKNQVGTLLQLEVPEFCLDMATAAERWIPTVTDPAALQRLGCLATIEHVDFGNALPS